MENVVFREIKNVDGGLVEKIVELEKRNCGRDASINQWVIPVIIRYGKLIVAKKTSSGTGRKTAGSKRNNMKESDNSGIIGVCEIIRSWKKENTVFIHSFYIDKSYRNKGIGKKFLQKVIDVLKKDNIKIIELTVDSGNEAAKRLYKRTGFKKAGFRKNEYGRGIDRDLMILKL